MEFFNRKINIFIGHYGVGKTTIAVNLAHKWAGKERVPVSLADIDVNNPYFRSRDWAEKMAKHGIDLIIPDEEIAYAEMPFLPKRIYAAFQQDQRLILDVGGYDTGTTVLGSLAEHLVSSDYQLWFVVNMFRPGMETHEEIAEMFERLQGLSRLKITGMINNSNLAGFTVPDHILQSENTICTVAERFHVPVFLNCADSSFLGELDGRLSAPVIPVQRLENLEWQ